MNSIAKRKLIIYILNGTKDANLDINQITEDLTITKESLNTVLMELRDNGSIDINENTIYMTVKQRIELAVLAIHLGTDFEKVSKSLGWLEFEELVALVFRENGYNTMSRYRFNAEGRRWEIDVLATSYPYIVCAE